MQKISRRATLLSCSMALALVACGGGGGGASPAPGGPQPPTTPPPPATPPPTQALEITQLELAQTHVLPEAGLQWTLANASHALHLIGGREALVMVRLSAGNAVNPQVEAWRDGSQIGAMPLSASVPPTEDGGPAYASDRHSATLPAAWLVPGLQLRVRADNYLAGAFRTPKVGADSRMTMRILPFYLFGANEANTEPLSRTAAPDEATVKEIFAKWPMATVVAQHHPARMISWPSLVLGPDGSRPAYVANNSNDEKAGWEIMGMVLNVMSEMMVASGDNRDAVQYYAPLMQLDNSGRYRRAGGGLGGGSKGTGDAEYSGIFIHEQGHAVGLPHQGDAYKEGRYPYVGGSLNGSTWGYDSTRKQFLATFVPTSASHYRDCKTQTYAGFPRQIDAQGRCIKQDPMQSGAGDQATGYRFATFSDYSSGQMQRYAEGRTRLDDKGERVYEGGAILPDAGFPGGHKRWDSLDLKWVNVNPVSTNGGLSGLDNNLPYKRDVPVHTIVMTHSLPGTAGASRVYPPLSYRGNLVRTIDPTDAAQRASIVPNTSTNYWYCHNGGCDYTVRVTYAGGTVRHFALQGGFRPWFGGTQDIRPEARDPNHPASFRLWAINVPGEQAIAKVELLDTPRMWEGVPSNARVLASYVAGMAANGVTAMSHPATACTELKAVAWPPSAMPKPRCTL